MISGSVRQAACAVALAFLLQGCQTGPVDAPPEEPAKPVPTLSLEEAKKVVAQFSGSFSVPPRSISDILSIARTIEYSEANCYEYSLPTLEDVKSGIRGMPSYSFNRGGPNDNLRRSRSGEYAAKSAAEQFYQGNTQISIEMGRLAVEQYGSETALVGQGRAHVQLALFLAHAGEFDESARNLRRAISIQSDAEHYWNNVYSFASSEFVLTLLDFHIAETEATNAASKGELIHAEALYRKALSILEDDRLSFENRYEFAELALARTITRQGRLLEAESLLRERLKNQLPSAFPLVAATFLRLSENLYEQGRYAEAEQAARATVRMYKGLCTSPDNLLWAEARNILAKALIGQERWEEGLAVFDEMRTALVTNSGMFESRFSGSVSRALALLKSGKAGQATGSLLIALKRSESRLGPDHYRSAEIRGFLAMAQHADGNREGASKNYGIAVSNLATAARNANAAGDTLKARNQRLRHILEAYMRFLVEGRSGSAGAIDAAAQRIFQFSELIRAQSVQRALTASGSRVVLDDPVLANLARQEQDAEKQIASVYATLENELSRPAADQSSQRTGVLRDTITQLQSARIALLNEIENRFPTYSNLVNPKPVGLAGAKSTLRPGEALIVTYASETQTYVWAVPEKGHAAFNVAPIGRETLRGEVDALRAALDPSASTLGDIPAFNLQRAYSLYERLLKPVASGWRAAKHLLVVADGPLGYLPLAVLPTKRVDNKAEAGLLFSRYRSIPWLARSHAISQLPSAGTLKSLRRAQSDKSHRQAFIGFGDPWFSKAQALEAEQAQLATRGTRQRVSFRSTPRTRAADSAELAQLPRLPETADEIRAMAKAMGVDPAGAVYVGRDATEGNVKSLKLNSTQVLAFATHGLVPGDLNGLTQPALALSAPELLGGQDDGLLTMGEIMGLKLDADWVVLSACNTGAGDGAGAEAVSGLGQAFFYAGTRALLVSNWPVETTSAKQLTTDLFFRQAANDNLTRAEALRLSMTGLMDGPGYIDPVSNKAVFSYAHPLFWAPFSIVGDGSGTEQTLNERKGRKSGPES